MLDRDGRLFSGFRLLSVLRTLALLSSNQEPLLVHFLQEPLVGDHVFVVVLDI